MNSIHNIRYYLAISFFVINCYSCQKTPNLGELNFLDVSHSEILQKCFANAEDYEIQIRYTQIDWTDPKHPAFKSYNYHVDTTAYFYPASTVKMPVAFLALEKINQLSDQGINISFDTPLHISAERIPPQSSVTGDSTSISGEATIAHYIHKLFVVSDNDAYNRLYEFVGPQEINRALYKKSIFTNSKITHRVGIGGFSSLENRYTPSFDFINGSDTIYHQDATYDETSSYPTVQCTSKGIAHINQSGSLVHQPFDFSQKNFISIPDLERSIKALFFPSSESSYRLSDEDRRLLYKSMSLYPKQSKAPIYPKGTYYDSYVKFLMFGDKKEDIPDHIQIYNKVGYAYGYLTDVAYIIDQKNKIDFLLTANIHVNANKIYNDGVYEYEDIGIPFLAELGRIIYQHELNRDRTAHLPEEQLRLTDY